MSNNAITALAARAIPFSVAKAKRPRKCNMLKPAVVMLNTSTAIDNERPLNTKTYPNVSILCERKKLIPMISRNIIWRITIAENVWYAAVLISTSTYMNCAKFNSNPMIHRRRKLKCLLLSLFLTQHFKKHLKILVVKSSKHTSSKQHMVGKWTIRKQIDLKTEQESKNAKLSPSVLISFDE